MEENEELEVGDLENLELDNILEHKNNESKASLVEPVLDEAGKKIINQNNKGKKELLLKKKKKFNIDDICNNILFGLGYCFFNSFLSLVTFYLYYIYEFTIKDTSLFIIVEVCLFLIMFICQILIAYLTRDFFKDNKSKVNNYALFIIINIYKIIFETFLYLLITLDSSHNQLDFPHFFYIY